MAEKTIVEFAIDDFLELKRLIKEANDIWEVEEWDFDNLMAQSEILVEISNIIERNNTKTIFIAG